MKIVHVGGKKDLAFKIDRDILWRGALRADGLRWWAKEAVFPDTILDMVFTGGKGSGAIIACADGSVWGREWSKRNEAATWTSEVYDQTRSPSALMLGSPSTEASEAEAIHAALKARDDG